MTSIQRRLSLGLIGVLLVVGLGLAQTCLWLFDKSLRSYLEAGLHDEARSLLVAIVRGPQGLQLDEQRLSATYQRPFAGLYFRIDFADKTWRSRSLWDRELQQPATAGLQEGLGDGPRSQMLLTYREDFSRYGEQFSITVARDYTPILQSFRQIQWIGLGLGIAALVLILLAQRYTVHAALRPLERVRQQIAQLQRGQRSELDDQVPVELEPLVGQVNHLLAHTEDTLRRSRNALGNLGHALKTPLAVLVSLSNREALSVQPELQSSLREQLQQIEQRLARELGRARLAGDVLPGAHFDCSAEVPGLLSTLQMIHHSGLDMDWQAPAGLRLPWDREDMLELLGNLLDNACKWADSLVRLRFAVDEQSYRITVEDDGPGITEAKRDEVLERGVRLDEQVDGHGLGLGIVRDIVEAWGGELKLEESELGGLHVAIRLPPRRGA